MALPGPTPGRTGFLLIDGEEGLLVWGNICHVPEVQCSRPDVAMVLDCDPVQAVRSRRDILERATAGNLPITGMHMSFPEFSCIARAQTSYVLQPQIWQYDLA